MRPFWRRRRGGGLASGRPSILSPCRRRCSPSSIRESDTLPAREARGDDDERHIAPLQLGTIERCVRLWSNPGELVLSPFAGIGSEGYVALLQGRRFIGIELKPEYADVAARNLRRAETLIHGQTELAL